MNMVHILTAVIIHVNMADTRIAAFRFPLGPASGFHALIPQSGGRIHHFLKSPSIQDGTYKP